MGSSRCPTVRSAVRALPRPHPNGVANPPRPSARAEGGQAGEGRRSPATPSTSATSSSRTTPRTRATPPSSPARPGAPRRSGRRSPTAFPEERAKGVYDVVYDVPPIITAHAPGWIDRSREIIVGLQTDAPLKRAIMPYDGRRMAAGALRTYGYPVSAELEKVFTEYRKTHNAGVFDAYTPEIRAARKAGSVTGLPDAYGRGRIIGDYRRGALYGVDRPMRWLPRRGRTPPSSGRPAAAPPSAVASRCSSPCSRASCSTGSGTNSACTPRWRPPASPAPAPPTPCWPTSTSSCWTSSPGIASSTTGSPGGSWSRPWTSRGGFPTSARTSGCGSSSSPVHKLGVAKYEALGRTSRSPAPPRPRPDRSRPPGRCSPHPASTPSDARRRRARRCRRGVRLTAPAGRRARRGGTAPARRAVARRRPGPPPGARPVPP